MNDDKLENLVKENLQVSRENNKILNKMNRGLMWGRVFRIAYWLILIGSAIGIFYIIQPFVEGLGEAYGSFSDFIGNPTSFIRDSFTGQ